MVDFVGYLDAVFFPLVYINFFIIKNRSYTDVVATPTTTHPHHSRCLGKLTKPTAYSPFSFCLFLSIPVVGIPLFLVMMRNAWDNSIFFRYLKHLGMHQKERDAWGGRSGGMRLLFNGMKSQGHRFSTYSS